MCVTTITNCGTHTSATVCATCAATFYKVTTGTQDTCVTGAGITNCAAHTSATVCLTCATGYLKSTAGDTCTGKITGCTTYASDTTCGVCGTGTTISTDKLKCDTNKAANAGIFSALSVAFLAFIALLN